MAQEGGRVAFTTRLTRRAGRAAPAEKPNFEAPARLLRHRRAASAGPPREIRFALKPQPLPKGAAHPMAPQGSQRRGTLRRKVGRRGAPKQRRGAASLGGTMLCRQWGGSRAALTPPARSPRPPAPGASLQRGTAVPVPVRPAPAWAAQASLAERCTGSCLRILYPAVLMCRGKAVV